MTDSAAPAPEVKLAKEFIATANEWRRAGFPIRSWPLFLREAERVSRAYLKEVDRG